MLGHQSPLLRIITQHTFQHPVLPTAAALALYPRHVEVHLALTREGSVMIQLLPEPW